MLRTQLEASCAIRDIACLRLSAGLAPAGATTGHSRLSHSLRGNKSHGGEGGEAVAVVARQSALRWGKPNGGELLAGRERHDRLRINGPHRTL